MYKVIERPMRPVILCAVILAASAAKAASPYEQSIVTINVTKQQVDRSTPWQKGGIRSETHMGTVVATKGGKAAILTTAFAVADATYLEMERFGESAKHRLRPTFIDYEVNLALLAPDKPEVLEGLAPLAIGGEMPLNASVVLFRPRDRYQLSQFTAKLTEVGVYTAVTSAYGVISYLFKVQQSGLGWSEPVVYKGKLYAISTGQDRNFVHALPSPIITHFLRDAHDESYRGFPTGGFAFAPLEDPNMRKLLKAESIKGGVHVTDVLDKSPLAGILQKNDVLFEINGTSLSEHGYYQHPRWGKIALRYLLNRMYSGDEIRLKVLREGKPETLTGTVVRFDSNRRAIPYYRYAGDEPHLIFGGLVFQELTRDYLTTWGNNWSSLAPYHFLYKWHYQNDLLSNAEEERVIILNRVLADDFNRGYDKLRNEIVADVNGQPVKTLHALREALATPVEKNGAKYAVIRLDYGAGEVVLSYQDLAAVHERLATTYQIQSGDSFFQM